MAGRKLEGCVLNKPNKQAILLGGKYINLSAISRSQSLDLSYLSKVINGIKPMSLNAGRKISAAIGMTIEELIEAIETRIQLRKEHQLKIIKQYQHRVSKENSEDEAIAATGIPPKPRLPSLRLPQDSQGLRKDS